MLTLPILLVVFFGIIEFSMLLLGDQTLAAAAAVGARQATMPQTTHAEVVDAVNQAIADWSIAPFVEVAIQVNGQPDSLAPLSAAQTGDRIEVVLTVDSTRAAPDLLKFVGLSLNSQALRASFTLRKE
ncbi:MAG TPA: TadE/TadG family type IV pilus assembly protein [Pirellulales bacterium]|nr:TadE/TadG family type IV pilus assembly protein [Pirellulales bacterium]